MEKSTARELKSDDGKVFSRLSDDNVKAAKSAVEHFLRHLRELRRKVSDLSGSDGRGKQ